MDHAEKYYIPHGTRWPILGSVGLFTLFIGTGVLLNRSGSGSWIMAAGGAAIIAMVFGWFGTVIGENEHGQYNLPVDRSFRHGHEWFIFSEVMFFASLLRRAVLRARTGGAVARRAMESRSSTGLCCGRTTRAPGPPTARGTGPRANGTSKPLERSGYRQSTPRSC